MYQHWVKLTKLNIMYYCIKSRYSNFKRHLCDTVISLISDTLIVTGRQLAKWAYIIITPQNSAIQTYTICFFNEMTLILKFFYKLQLIITKPKLRKNICYNFYVFHNQLLLHFHLFRKTSRRYSVGDAQIIVVNYHMHAHPCDDRFACVCTHG